VSALERNISRTSAYQGQAAAILTMADSTTLTLALALAPALALALALALARALALALALTLILTLTKGRRPRNALRCSHRPLSSGAARACSRARQSPGETRAR
jgi:hypothetical protein